MPKYNTTDDDMMDDAYGGEDQMPSEGESDSKSVDEENELADTTVVPNSILDPDDEGLKEGDEIVVRVVKNYGDESEIQYAPKKGSEDYEEPMSTEEKELTALSEEGEE